MPEETSSMPCTKEKVSGKGKIVFRSASYKTKIRNPLHDFQATEQTIELRKDPLTNYCSRVNRLRSERVVQTKTMKNDVASNLENIIKQSSKDCAFCPKFLHKKTPRFIEALNLGDRVVQGSFTIFPNMYVFSQFHGVGILGTKHFRLLNEFPTELWANALRGSITFFKAIHKFEPLAKYPSINFNYLPPSASSVVHPHIQVIQDCQPTKNSAIIFELCKKYSQTVTNCKDSSGIYWLDLLASEKTINRRFIWENEAIAWIASYSPSSKNELTGVVKIPKTDITTFSDKEVCNLAEGLKLIFKALYEKRKVSSVNMASYIGAIGENHSSTNRIIFKIASRPDPTPNYKSDVGFLELLHSETVAEVTPEEVAKSLRQNFQ